MKDIDIRLVLNAKLARKYAGQAATVIVHELGIQNGSARVDIAVVNGILSGYEIKSQRDTLKRLPHQVAAYGQVFDRMTLIVHEQHLNEAVDIIPAWWGLQVVSQPAKALKFKTIRRGQVNANPNPYALASLVWRGGSLSILQAHGLDKGLRSATREKLWAALASGLPLEVLQDEVRTAVRHQQAWLARQAEQAASQAR